jgi:hypothetical protein
MPKLRHITKGESIAELEKYTSIVRQIIDTNDAMPPECRAVMHAALDEKLLEAKERVLNAPAIEEDEA